MSRLGAPRALTLTEELEKLEQSITLTLQEIDESFSKAHRIVTSSIIPIVEQYAKHSNDVWEGSKFWKQFFEASANVSLSGYEEAALDEAALPLETPSNDLATPTGPATYDATDAQNEQSVDDESFSVDSPTQVTGPQSTPRLPSSKKKVNGRTATGPKTTTAAFASPSPRKYTGKNLLALGSSPDGPSTPQAQSALDLQSSPFEPRSAFQPSAFQPSAAPMRAANDPIMHRGVLDKNYRIQATPHTQRRQSVPKRDHTPATATATATATRGAAWDNSPQSSPLAAAPQLRTDLFSPARRTTARTRTPGVSVLTPAARRAGDPVPTTSTGRRLFSPQDKAYGPAARAATHGSFAFGSDDELDFGDEGAGEDDDDTDSLVGMSPPKTLQFHVPQSRLLQTPAREASRRIVADLLSTAGADDPDEMEDDEDGELYDGRDDDDDTGPLDDATSPSVVRRAHAAEDDTF